MTNILVSDEHLSNCLLHYDADSYNTFETPEKAHTQLKKHPSFNKFLEDAFKLIEEENVPLGFRLLHKHQSVLKTQGMVETFVESFSTFGVPAYITRPYSISYEKNSFTIEETKKVYPASWEVRKGNSYRIFEFSTDEDVCSTNEKLSGNPLVHTIFQMILKHNLESLIGLAIVSRSTSSHFKSSFLLEKTFFNYGSVLTISSDLNRMATAIQTSWSLKRNDLCEVDCNYCSPSGDGHEMDYSHVCTHSTANTQ